MLEGARPSSGKIEAFWTQALAFSFFLSSFFLLFFLFLLRERKGRRGGVKDGKSKEGRSCTLRPMASLYEVVQSTLAHFTARFPTWGSSWKENLIEMTFFFVVIDILMLRSRVG